MQKYQQREKIKSSNKSVDYSLIQTDKHVLQNPNGPPSFLINASDDEKANDKQQQLKNMSNFLKLQIAKKLQTLHENKT